MWGTKPQVPSTTNVLNKTYNADTTDPQGLPHVRITNGNRTGRNLENVDASQTWEAKERASYTQGREVSGYHRVKGGRNRH